MKRPIGVVMLSAMLWPSAAIATQFPLVSTFANGDPEGWVTFNVEPNPWVLGAIPWEAPDSGTPAAPAPAAGLLSFYDMDPGDWGFVNDTTFSGDLSAAFGGTLSFRQRWNTLEPGPYPTENFTPNVVLAGHNEQGLPIAIVHFNPVVLAREAWHPFSQQLDASGGWYWVDENTPFQTENLTPATGAQIQQVLRKMTFLYILGEFFTGADRGELDDVTISAPIPTITVDDATKRENEGTLAFRVRLSAAAAVPISLAYQTAELAPGDPGLARATLGRDFVGLSSTLLIPAGTLATTLEVPLIDDSVIEPATEAFRLLLTKPANALLANAQAIGSIVDDDSDAYGLWATAHGLTGQAAGPDADFDGDGVPNSIERLLNSDPAGFRPGDGRLVAVAGAPTGRQRFQFSLLSGPRLNWVLESSSTLLSWIQLEAPLDYILQQDVAADGVRHLQFEVPLSPGGRNFWRIRVTAD